MAAARETLTTGTTLELIKIPEAMALLVGQGLDPDDARLLLTGALLGAKLLGGDQKGPDRFTGLAANLQHLSNRGVVEADLKAIHRLSRKLSIPWESWEKWISDGSVDWKNSEIARDFGDQVVIFTPVFRREDLLSLVPRFELAGEQLSVASNGSQSNTIRSNLQNASTDRLGKAVRAVYGRYPKRAGPNLNQVVPFVQDHLAIDGFTAEFDDARGKVGKHRKTKALGK
jgi:hypothetical protein